MQAQIVLPYDKIARLCEQHHIRKLALFGSTLRDDFNAESDVDLLAEFAPDTQISYFDLAKIQREFGDLFGRPVDVGTPEMLSPYIKSEVLQSAQTIYEYLEG